MPLKQKIYCGTRCNAGLDAGPITSGVLQGSTLGLLLFVIQNILPQALNEAGLYLCADDTVSFIRIRIFKKEKSVIHRLFVTLSMVVDNKLSIHFKDNKTKIFFYLEKKPHQN